MNFEIYYVAMDGSKRVELTASEFSCSSEEEAKKRLADTQASAYEAVRRRIRPSSRPATIYYLRRTDTNDALPTDDLLTAEE